MVTIATFVYFYIGFQEHQSRSQYEENLIGNWINKDSTIQLTFETNKSCFAYYNDTTHSGTWKFIKTFYMIEINWDSPVFKLPHPNNPGHLYTISSIDYTNEGQNLQLYTRFDPYPDYTLYKIT
jgi:hypothetical protein